jgi:hypothetical protein
MRSFLAVLEVEVRLEVKKSQVTGTNKKVWTKKRSLATDYGHVTRYILPIFVRQSFLDHLLHQETYYQENTKKIIFLESRDYNQREYDIMCAWESTYSSFGPQKL